MTQGIPTAVTTVQQKLSALPNCNVTVVSRPIIVAKTAPPSVDVKSAAIYVTVKCTPAGRLLVVRPTKGESIHVVAKNVRITLGLEQGMIMDTKKTDAPHQPIVRRLSDGLPGLEQVLTDIRAVQGAGEPRVGSRYQQANTMAELEVRFDRSEILVHYVYECRAVEIQVPCLEGTKPRTLVVALRAALKHPGINLQQEDAPPYLRYARKKKPPKRRAASTVKPTESL